MASRSKKAASDLTGRQVAVASEARDEEQKRKAEEMSMATATAAKAIKDEIVDLTEGEKPEEGEKPDGDVEVTEVEVALKYATIRVNENIDMTYGRESYKLDVGPQYKVPQYVADHLEEKGVVWH